LRADSICPAGQARSHIRLIELVAAMFTSTPSALTNSEGNPWTSDGFRASWRKACAAAGVVGVTFNDLRGTAVTRLAMVEATEAEIATITGHSLRDVRSILDAHYLARDPALGESAISIRRHSCDPRARHGDRGSGLARGRKQSHAVIVGRVSLEAAPPSACHDHAETVSILVNNRKRL
jgi:hypothetical protein